MADPRSPFDPRYPFLSLVLALSTPPQHHRAQTQTRTPVVNNSAPPVVLAQKKDQAAPTVPAQKKDQAAPVPYDPRLEGLLYAPRSDQFLTQAEYKAQFEAQMAKWNADLDKAMGQVKDSIDSKQKQSSAASSAVNTRFNMYQSAVSSDARTSANHAAGPEPDNMFEAFMRL